MSRESSEVRIVLVLDKRALVVVCYPHWFGRYPCDGLQAGHLRTEEQESM